MIRLWGLCLFCMTLAPVTAANESSWPLEGKNEASGAFEQTVRDVNGDLAFVSSGRFLALKPDHFRWDIEAPDKQVLIATPNGFWQWDKDLDVVILRDAPDFAHLPISSIWSGAMSLKPDDNTINARLGGDIKALAVHSTDAGAIVVLFEDALGQETQFVFTLDSEPLVPVSSFELTVPSDADFYDESSRRTGLSGVLE